MNWNLWTRGPVERKVEVKRPLLDLWDKSTNLQMIELKTYLDEVMAALSSLPASGPLYLHMDIDVERSEHLLRGNDLDNYLFPFFRGAAGSRLNDSSL